MKLWKLALGTGCLQGCIAILNGPQVIWPYSAREVINARRFEGRYIKRRIVHDGRRNSRRGHRITVLQLIKTVKRGGNEVVPQTHNVAHLVRNYLGNEALN